MRASSWRITLVALLCVSACGSSPDVESQEDDSDSTTDDLDPTTNDLTAEDLTTDDLNLTEEEREALLSLSPKVLPDPPVDVTNAFADDPAAAAFGQRLFFTAAFAGPLLDSDHNIAGGGLGSQGEVGKVSCASCHVPDSGFSDTRSPSQQISLGSGWGLRKAPSLLDVGQTKLLLWDGRRDSLFNQVFGPIESPVEMNSSRLFVAEQVFNLFRDEYEAIFGAMPPLDDAARFPALTPSTTGCSQFGHPRATCQDSWRGSPGDNADYDQLTVEDQKAVTRVVANVGKAIAAYERLLTCGPSRFDAWIHGAADALSASEQRGAKLFVGAAGCADCHSGPFFSDEKFHNVGVSPVTVASGFVDDDDHGAKAGLAAALVDPLNSKGVFSDGDDGRLPDAPEPEWEGAFRTPMLRCVSQRPSFFHTGQVQSLESAVAFFNGGGAQHGYYGTKEIAPLGLDAEQVSDIVAFLRALDGPGAAAELREAL